MFQSGDKVLSAASPANASERLTLTYAFSEKRKAGIYARVIVAIK